MRLDDTVIDSTLGGLNDTQIVLVLYQLVYSLHENAIKALQDLDRLVMSQLGSYRSFSSHTEFTEGYLAYTSDILSALAEMLESTRPFEEITESVHKALSR